MIFHICAFILTLTQYLNTQIHTNVLAALDCVSTCAYLTWVWICTDCLPSQMS